MKLISEIEIKNFRSFSSVKFKDLGDFNIVVGLNNSGKSNFLRSLNAFFTGETDPGVKIKVDSDYHKPALKSRKKKFISISVHFSLPETFKFHKKLSEVESFLESRVFSITKYWDLYQEFPDIYMNDQATPLNERNKYRVEQFLSLISFRYIPNRVLPLETIRNESEALKDFINRRIRGKSAFSDIFIPITEISNRFSSAVARQVNKTGMVVEDISIAVPRTVSDLIYSFKYDIKEDGYTLKDTVQGAGLQSYLMLESLLQIDREYYRKFGWKQAAVWAIEEPESSMHSTLIAESAKRLSYVAKEKDNRLQIFGTTHSDFMTAYSDRTFITKKDNMRSNIETGSTYDMITKSNRMGISQYTHPLLHYFADPIIIVEGKYDYVYLSKALRLLGLTDKCMVTFLYPLTGGESSGGDTQTNRYVKNNMDLIRTRPSNKWVLLLMDWENHRSVQELETRYAEVEAFRVMAWPENLANPDLNNTFRGIERFYPTSIIMMGIQRKCPIGTLPNGQYQVHPSSYDNDVKPILSDLIEEELVYEDLVRIEGFIKRDILQ